MKLSKPTILYVLIILAFPALALDRDLQQPLEITSDKAYFDQSTGVAIYEGNVIANQGSINIEAQYLEITADAATQTFQKIHARGKPARFRQQIDPGGTMMIGYGNSINYQIQGALLDINGEGYMKRGTDEINADYIQYKLNEGTFIAEKKDKGRVTMTLQPQQSSPQPSQ